MATENKISVTLSPEPQAQILSQLDLLASSLTWTQALTPDERRRQLRAGDASEAFISKALQLGQRYPQLVPAALSVEEMAKDVELRPFLQELKSRLGTLHLSVDDTLKIASAEAFEAGLGIYKGAKAFGQGMGIDDQIEELARRFKTASKSTASSTPE